MTKKIQAAAILAAALFASAAYAAAPTPEPVPPVQASAEAAKLISMSEAVAAAEKAYSAKAVTASVHGTRAYGTVWDVRLAGEKGERLRVFVDASTGKILAANSMGIRDGRPMPPPGSRADCPYADCPMVDGYGYDYGPHHRRGRHHRDGGCWW